MNLNPPCPPELMEPTMNAPTATDPVAALPAPSGDDVARMAAALQAGIDEAAALAAIESKMRQGGLSPERGDLCFAPMAWKAVIKSPPPWLSFSVLLTDKPIFTPARHLELKL